MRQRRRLEGPMARVVACLALLLVAGALFLLNSGPEPSTGPIELEELTIDVPESVDAGQAFDVVVGRLDGDEPVTLFFNAGYGPVRYEAVADDGQATFTVETGQGPGSGTAVVDVRSATGYASGVVHVVPGDAVDSVDVYLGPRTVVADAEDFTMVVAVPVDQFGNPVVPGTHVDFVASRTRPGTEPQRFVLDASTDGLVAYVDIVAGSVAGRTSVGVAVGEANGPERSFLEVADVPEVIELSAIGAIPAADGASLFEISTSVLADQNGNVVPDGTIAFLHAEGVVGVGRLSGTSIDGVVTFVVEAPDQPGVAKFAAHASGAASSPLVIDFEPAVTDVPVAVASEGDTLVVTVGRVVGNDGAYVSDGTVALISIGQQQFEVELELGLATLEVDMTQSPVVVSVLGVPSDSMEDNR